VKPLDFLEIEVSQSGAERQRWFMDENLHEDMDRRILHSETRIKNWVIAGVLANLLVLIGIGAPLVYYLGSISAQSTMAITQLSETNNRLAIMDRWIRRHEVWDATVEAWMESQGYRPPPSAGRGNSE